MERFILINNERNRIKVFEPFEDVSKSSPSIDAIMISYGCVYKRSSKPVMKGLIYLSWDTIAWIIFIP